MILRYKRQVKCLKGNYYDTGRRYKRQVKCLKGNYYDTEIQETGQMFEEQLL